MIGRKFKHLSPTIILTNDLQYDITSGPEEHLLCEIETEGHSNEFTQRRSE